MKKTKKISKKTAKKDSTGAKSGSFYQKYKLGVNSALIVLVIFGGWFVYSLPRMQEKQDLITKHEKLEAIADKISAVNKPDKRESSRTCGYQSQVYGKGDLYCTVKTTLYYQGVDVNKANLITSETSKLASLSPLRNPSFRTETVFPQLYDSQLNSFYQDVDFSTNRGCGINYAYPSPLQDSKNLVIFLSCTQPAKAEHFPLEK